MEIIMMMMEDSNLTIMTVNEEVEVDVEVEGVVTGGTMMMADSNRLIGKKITIE